jgi:hypothetical protein
VSRTRTFLAIAGMFFAILVLWHPDTSAHWGIVLFGRQIPGEIAVGAFLLAMACLLAWGATTILFHFKNGTLS